MSDIAILRQKGNFCFDNKCGEGEEKEKRRGIISWMNGGALSLFLFLLLLREEEEEEEIERADKTVTRSNVQGALNPAIKTSAHVYYFI